MGLVVSLEGKKSAGPSIDPLVRLTATGMDRVNQLILHRVGSDVALIPEIASTSSILGASACGPC